MCNENKPWKYNGNTIWIDSDGDARVELIRGAYRFPFAINPAWSMEVVRTDYDDIEWDTLRTSGIGIAHMLRLNYARHSRSEYLYKVTFDRFLENLSK